MKPYPEQLEAVDIAANAGRGTLSMVTGFGKSYTMALLINRLQVRTLIVVPNLSLKRQLTECFLMHFGSLNNITIENIDSTALLTAVDYDCLIIDEAHHVAAKTYRLLNRKVWNKIYYRFFFTATPFRSKDEELILMESISGDIIYTVDHAKAVANKYIVPMEAYFIDLPETSVQGNANSWHSVYAELIVNNTLRNAIIARLLSNLYILGHSTLCLVKEIKHGEDIKAQCQFDCAFIKGENDNNREKILEYNLGYIKSMIGTNGVLGEGVDTKPAEYVIIAGLGKSKNQFMQQCGRAFRTYPGKETCKIIIFRDKSHRWTLSHFKAQCKYLLEEYGITPVQLMGDKE